MASLFAPHWISEHRGPEDRERFARWNPAFVKIVCVDERPPYLEDIPAGATVVVRNHPLSENNGNRRIVDLADAKRMAAEHANCCDRMATYCESRGVPRSRLLFEGLNEPQVWSSEPPDLLAAYYAWFLTYLHGHGLHGVALNFGVGWPGNGGVKDAPPIWAPFEPVRAAMQPGDCLGLHEYWDIGGPMENWRWWGGRFLQCPWDEPILITECGIDRGVSGNQGGWWELPGSFEQKAKIYVEQLAWYETQLRKDGRVQGAFIFTYDMSGKDWEHFNIRNDVFMSAFLPYAQAQPAPAPYQPKPPVPPQPPTPQPTDTLVAALKAEFGAQFADLRTVLPRHATETYDPREMAVVRRIIIHHTAPPAGAHETWAGDAAYHVSLGWPGIGYHIGVEPDGKVSYLEDVRLITYHASASNTTSIGVACMGNYEIAQPTAAMLDSLKRVIAVLTASLGKAFSVQGHKDVDGSTLCPGANLYPLIPTLGSTPAPADPVDVIRAMAWQKMGVALNPNAALVKYARANKLGAPLSNEMEAQGYVFQCYEKAICYCKRGDWGNAKVLDW